MKSFYAGLGSNMGDRETYLCEAISRLQDQTDIRVLRKSPIYETEPFGYKDQDHFLNMVIQGETALSPFQLLEVTQKIELELGRKRLVHWGPRTIDIDILLYENQIIESDHLTIPHPGIKDRLFVLKPLSDLYLGAIPGGEQPIILMVKQLEMKGEGVRKWRT